MWISKKEYRQLIESQHKDFEVIRLQKEICRLSRDLCAAKSRSEAYLSYWQDVRKECKQAHKGIARLRRKIKRLEKK